MANTILLKRKLTAGAPSLASLQVGEVCLVIPDEAIYWKKDAATLVGPLMVAGVGDMLKSMYDTNADGKVNASDDADKLGGVAAANYALQSWVLGQINSLVNAAPGALDTLKELATALGNDPNFATTIATALGQKLDANSTIDGGVL